jgi:predicted acylesterase/phospholipase RssA
VTNGSSPRLPRRSLLALPGLLALGVAGCSVPSRLPAVPAGETTEARIPGIPKARFFADTETAALAQEVVAAREREIATRARAGLSGPLPPADLLAISGGGSDGAFGAGLLSGWTRAGTRPDFKLVTGVSTGALSAPFAFLGPQWDGQLTAVYTGIKPEDVFVSRGLTAAIWNDALASTRPLWKLISRYANEEMLAAIARAYQEGRLLLIGTTNLDAGRPVIWNIGAIAASGQPGALDLIRKILLASAAIPGAFPPVLFDVEVNGRRYQEMHVDGGAIAQMFLYPAALAHEEAFRGTQRRAASAWLIRNSRLDPDWHDVERSTLGIVQEAIAQMIYNSGRNDVQRLYQTAMRDHLDFNLAYIGPDFTMKAKEEFDPVFMRALYDYAYAKAAAGYPWAKRPPWVPEGEATFGAAPPAQSAAGKRRAP